VAGGFQTSDEMSSVASKVNGEVGPIGDEADAVGKTHVAAADGGRDFGDKATAYINALNNNVVASIKAIAAALWLEYTCRAPHDPDRRDDGHGVPRDG
jgi:hypothetical protein